MDFKNFLILPVGGFEVAEYILTPQIIEERMNLILILQRKVSAGNQMVMLVWLIM